MVSILEWVSIILMCGTVVLGLFIEAGIIDHVRNGDEDYRVRLLKQQMEDQKEETNKIAEWLAKATAKAKAREEAKKQYADDKATAFENPLQDDAKKDGPEEGQG